MKVVAIIQARTASTRYQGKIFAPLWGSTVLRQVVGRTAHIVGLDAVAVACPEADRDAITAHIREEFPEVYVVAASDVRDEDVLTRYQLVARHLQADLIVRITADCPALNVDLASLLVHLAKEAPGDFALASSAAGHSMWPDGWDVEVFTMAMLDRAHRYAAHPADREHVTPWMYRYERNKIRVICPVPLPNWKFSVDTPEDLARLELLGRPA